MKAGQTIGAIVIRGADAPTYHVSIDGKPACLPWSRFAQQTLIDVWDVERDERCRRDTCAREWARVDEEASAPGTREQREITGCTWELVWKMRDVERQLSNCRNKQLANEVAVARRRITYEVDRALVHIGADPLPEVR